MNEMTTQQYMSSREIAELYGKPHNDTLKKIRSLEDAYIQAYGTEGNFSLSNYKDSTGRSLPEILLSKSQALFVASRFDAVLHAKIQKRWEDLESGNVKPIAHQPSAPTVPGVLDTDKVFRAALRMAKAMGIEKNAAVISANQLCRRVTGNDAMALLEHSALPTQSQDRPCTPTEIGAMFGVSAREVNKGLIANGYQTKVETPSGSMYLPTEKGKPFAVLIDTEKRHKSGAMVTQLKWRVSLADKLKPAN